MERSKSSVGPEQPPSKKVKVHHHLHHVQQRPSEVEPAPQDPEFAEGQLLRSITAALTLAGFDSVRPTALEMFRSHVEEYMLSLLSDVRASMQTYRRASPTAQDFRLALAHMPNSSTASLLAPQLEVELPEALSYPSIPQPGPPHTPAPNLSALLQPLLLEAQPQYIPSHFPQLPPQHAWKETPVFPTREKDSRKMREKATEEGMLAEQALRKLAAAAKAGAMKAESRRRSSAPLAGTGRVRDGGGRKRPAPEMLFDDMLKDVAEVNGGDYAMALDGVDESDKQPTQSELEERVVRGVGGALPDTLRHCMHHYPERDSLSEKSQYRLANNHALAIVHRPIKIAFVLQQLLELAIFEVDGRFAILAVRDGELNMAADLGKRLLAEVQEVGLDEILDTLRLQHNPEPAYFGIPCLDKLVNAATSTSTSANKPNSSNPVIELTSQTPGSGTAHLLYLLTATAILPTQHGGKSACVAILDTDGTFSVARLVHQLKRQLHLEPDKLASTLTTALTHVHIFRPQSLSSLIATIASLPSYLLHTSHPSNHRSLAFIALDSATAFHWQSKAESEELAIANQQQQPPSSTSPSTRKPAQTSALSPALRALTTTLYAPLILTSHSPSPPISAPLPTLRLTIQRRPVRAFPPTLSISEALREGPDRQRAVQAAGWEVRVVDLTADQRGLRGLGFGFRVSDEGVVLEEGSV
ncbi:hypothetical protein Q7P37_009565 [Cladosporium fusiforme]